MRVLSGTKGQVRQGYSLRELYTLVSDVRVSIADQKVQAREESGGTPDYIRNRR